MPTLVAAAGEPDVKEKLLTGYAGRRQDLQGPPRRLQPAAVPDRPEPSSARKEFFYFNDDGDLVALRYENWKLVFVEQRAAGHLRRSGRSRSLPLRVPKMFDLRADPYRAGRHHVEHLLRLAVERAFLLVRRRPSSGKFLADLQGVPAAAEAGELQRRPGDGEAERSSGRRQ